MCLNGRAMHSFELVSASSRARATPGRHFFLPAGRRILPRHAVNHRDLATAHSILPLAVLEAMRNLDSPSDEEVAEYVDELLKKRLGLSDTVAAQIGRYEAVVRKDQPVRAEEAEQILRLAGRRTDAALVFADGGRRAARRAVRRLSRLTRFGARYFPGPIRRALGFRGSRRAADEVFGASIQREGGAAVAVVRHNLALKATPDGAACAFFAAGLAELLRQLTDFDGSLAHSRCQCRGADCCEWRSTNAGGTA